MAQAHAEVERTLSDSAKRAQRPERIPVSGKRDVLTFKNRSPGFEYRVVKDKPGRIDRFLDGGYEIVTHPTEVGDKRVATPAPEGSPVKISLGHGEHGYLMRIPEEFYKEDQKRKQDDIDATEAAMRRKPKEDGYYGEVKITERK